MPQAFKALIDFLIGALQAWIASRTSGVARPPQRQEETANAAIPPNAVPQTHLAALLAAGVTPERAQRYLEPLTAAMVEFDINTPQRIAAFLAQVCHESGLFRYAKEVWGPTPAQEGYEGRADLGNNQPGDGKKFMGRGPIETTGKKNYMRVSSALYGDAMILVRNPEILEQPVDGCRSSAWFWFAHGCNELADEGNFERITRVINGGLNGYDNRKRLWALLKAAMGVA